VYADRCPSLLQKGLDVCITQRSELVDEANPGEKLRVPGDTFFDSGHADEHRAETALIEDGTQLLQTVHRQSICFIDHYQGSWVRDCLELGFVLVERVIVGRLEREGMVGPVISILTMLDAPSVVPATKNIERRLCSARVPRFATLQRRARAALTSFSIRAGVLTTSGVKRTVSIGLASEASLFACLS